MEIKEGERWLVVRRPNGQVTMWDLYHCAIDGYILVDLINNTVRLNIFEEEIAPIIKGAKPPEI